MSDILHFRDFFHIDSHFLVFMVKMNVKKLLYQPHQQDKMGFMLVDGSNGIKGRSGVSCSSLESRTATLREVLKMGRMNVVVW